jgi:hypothetical protein
MKVAFNVDPRFEVAFEQGRAMRDEVGQVFAASCQPPAQRV